MHHDMLVAGKQAQQDLDALHHKNEFGGPYSSERNIGVTILKVLTVITGIFFSFLSMTTLPPDLAFLSITLIIVVAGSLLLGAEKIIAIFPKTIWITNRHHPLPPTAYYTPPPPRSYGYWHPYRWFNRRTNYPPPAAPSVPPATTRRRSPSGSSELPKYPRFTSSSSKTYVGGGHASSPVAGGTNNNVAVGSRKHDRDDQTAGGNVPVGGRRTR